MGTEISGQGAGSQPKASTIVESTETSVDKEEAGTGSGSRPRESGTIDRGKRMGIDESGGAGGPRPVDDRVARRRQDPLGRRLKQMYDEVVRENIPEDFLSFLEKADERLTDSVGDGGSGSADPGKTSKP
jgi:Anti-sigma factor NepR